jgi:aminoglycoside 3-N-acetyltransferase
MNTSTTNPTAATTGYNDNDGQPQLVHYLGHDQQLLGGAMSEADTVARTPGEPATIHSLAADFHRLGVAPGMTLLVHSSLSALGWVCGGTVAVVLALEEALGPQGTLVMPTHSGDLSEPSRWQHPPVPTSWWPIIRETMPAYDPDLTPTRGMGSIAEAFRKQRGVLRSSHPEVSFAAWGAHAEAITANHEFDNCLGEGSPLARLYDLDGWVMLLGVGHENNTSLHLAEYRADYPGKALIECGAPMLVNGQRQWVTFQDIEADESDFEAIGADFARETGKLVEGKAAQATALLMPQRALVDYAAGWMARNRRA